MNGRTGFSRIACAGVACLIVVIGLGVTGCAAAPVTDAGGLTIEEAQALSLADQYALAGERWVEFNEVFAREQREIRDTEWEKGTRIFDVVPALAGSRARWLDGATDENSYYYMTFRKLPLDEDAEPILRETKARWATRFAEVSEYRSLHGRLIVTASNPGGLWMKASEVKGGIGLSAHSPLFWGDAEDVLIAVGDRRFTEADEGVVWAPEIGENGTSLHLPGDYRPFPLWETEPAEWSPLPEDFDPDGSRSTPQ